MQSAGIDHYRFVAALDHKTCPRCGGIDGLVFEVTEAMPGENYPPMHPRCRCTVVPTLGETTGKRTSKVDGKRVKVPAEMNYTEWKAVYIDKTKTLADWENEHKPLQRAANGYNYRTGILSERRIAEIKAAEDKAFTTPTGANFGFKMFKGTPDWAKELNLVNDVNVGIERRLNCQRCVVAHEAGMRKYDVMARPSWGEKDPMRNNRNWLSAFNYSPSDIKKARGETIQKQIESVENIMRSFGVGTRTIIWFSWKGLDVQRGHAIVAICRENGVINFGDPQRKIRSAKNIFESAEFDTIGILRVDKLKFTNGVKKCCMNRD